MREKKYVVFEQEWFQHIHRYMKEDGGQLWKSVLSRTKVAANDLDQRLVISTITYHVHDLMTEKVKEFEELSQSMSESAEHHSPIVAHINSLGVRSIYCVMEGLHYTQCF